MQPVVPFKTDDFSIRAVEIDGEPWFVGKDIAEALGYSDTVNAIKLHCRGVVKHHPISDSLGRKQNTRLINEPDLFRLVVNSQLPAAEQFEQWVFEEVLPSIRKTGGYQSQRTAPQDALTRALKLTPLAVRALRAFGFEKNAAAISANQLVRKETQIDLLALSGTTSLIAENQASKPYTPTELGMRIGGLSGQKVNKLLEAAGLQSKQTGDWLPTAQGKPHSVWQDTARRHNDGTPVPQLKWYDSVLPIIEAIINQKEVA